MQISMPPRSGTPTKGLRTPMTPSSPSRYTDYFQPRRRIHVVRLLAIGLSLVLCYLVATRGPETSTWVPSAVQDGLGMKDHSEHAVGKTENSQKSYGYDGYGSSDDHRWTDAEKSATTEDDEIPHTVDPLEGDEEAEYEKLKDSQADDREPKIETGDVVEEGETDEEESPVTPSHHTQSNPFVAHNVGSGETYSFKDALKDVLHMVPDEIYTRDLLRPIEGGGQDRLKELGIRARAFNKFFTIWEALHVIADEKLTYIRDDIIQYLENAPARELAGISRMERGDIVRAYERYRSFLSRLSNILYPWTAPYFADHMTLHAHFRNGGRGIVLSGNDKQAPFFLTSIESFRRLGCNLPVEIMYMGENDLNDDWRMRLEAIPGVTTRDLSQMVTDDGWELKGWASKAFALLMSSFREVIYLDADALFFVNPEDLFDDPGYAETGALFFRDRVFAPSSRKQWLKDILPKPISKKAQTSRYWTGESREQQESGCMVVDKWRHFVAMMTVTRMNGPDRDDDPKTGAKGVYSLFYGDKETFWLGWELAGDTDYWFHEGAAGNMGTLSEHYSYELVDGRATVLEDFMKKESHSEEHEKPEETKKETHKESEETKEEAHKKENKKEGEKTGEKKLDIKKEGEKFGEKIHDTKKEGEKFGENIHDIKKEGKKHDDKKGSSLQTRSTKGPFELFVINSPQLLHLDLDGRPLWFNGWILDDKYEEQKHVNVSTWEYFLSEVKTTGEAPEWRIGGHNMATLKSNDATEFSNSEKEVLDMIVEVARENGALKPGQ